MFSVKSEGYVLDVDVMFNFKNIDYNIWPQFIDTF
jgi:hypothetical protein